MSVKLEIIAVDVFLERRKTRILVGQLKKENSEFVFRYVEQYLRARNVIPLGPELPLTKREFQSKSLFLSLADRIPSRENPAYPEYCYAMGIDPSESDVLILLSTIGKRGPSSFVFAPVFKRALSSEEVIIFRKTLRLTTREFARIFELSQKSLNAFERRQASGKDLVKRLEMIIRFPQVALYLLTINNGILQHEKWLYAEAVLKSSKNQ